MKVPEVTVPPVERCQQSGRQDRLDRNLAAWAGDPALYEVRGPRELTLGIFPDGKSKARMRALSAQCVP